MKRLICLLAACLLVFSCGMFAVSADHVHDLEYIRARDARIAKPGNIAHYYCSGCGKYFADSAGEKELTEAEIFTQLPCHTPNNTDTGKGCDFSMEALVNLDASMQGTAIFGEYLFVANNEAEVRVYDIPSGKQIGEFLLASATPHLNKGDPHANHSNSMMFSTQKWDEKDAFPLLYISTGNTGDFYDTDGSYIAKCAVERIVMTEGADGKITFTSQLVQTIAYADRDHVIVDQEKYNGTVETFKQMYKDGRFTYIGNDTWSNPENYQKVAWGWPASFVDSDPTEKTAGKFYLHSARFRTTEKWEGLNKEIYGDKDFNYYKDNAYIVTEFDLPALPESEADFGRTVTLYPADITDQFETEFDIYFTQGGTLYQGKIYYPFGNGGKYGSTTANAIRIFDLEQEKIVARLDLSADRIGMGAKEPEGCCIYKGYLCFSSAKKTADVLHSVNVIGYVALDDGKGGTVCSMCGQQLSGEGAKTPTTPTTVPSTTAPAGGEEEMFDPFFILMFVGDLIVVGSLLWMMKRRNNG